MAVTFVTRARPQLAAHPNGVKNFHPTWRRSDQLFRAKLREDPRDHLTDRTDAVRQFLLIHRSRERTASSRTHDCEVKEVACNALADRRERVSGKLFQGVV